MRKQLTIAGVALNVLSIPASALDCEAILSQGIWNYSDTASDFLTRQDISHWANDYSHRNESANLSIYGQGDGAYNNDQENKKSEGLREKTETSFQFRQILKTTSNQIINAWLDCMHWNSNREGETASFKYTTEPLLYKILFRVHHPRNNIDVVQLKVLGGDRLPDCLVENATNFDSARKNATITIEDEREYICSRESLEKPTHIQWQFKNGQNGNILLPSVKKPRLLTCTEFMERSKNPFIACNNHTAPGFYWKVGTKQDGYYSNGPQVFTDNPNDGIAQYKFGEQIECNEIASQIQTQGQTIRYPPKHATFLEVRKQWGIAAGGRLVSPECNNPPAYDLHGNLLTGDLSGICGYFAATCTRQPDQ